MKSDEERAVYIATSPDGGRGGVAAFFAIRLESIGVCKSEEIYDRGHIARILNRQVDFIATLPGLGEGSAVELRYDARPEPLAPHRGRVDVIVRVRVVGVSEAAAYATARAAYHGIYPNLVALGETYEWVPVTSGNEYRRLYAPVDRIHVAELRRREAVVRLGRLEPLPRSRPMGFVTTSAPDDDAITAEEPGVHVISPFLRSPAGLTRLFEVLLRQPSRTIVSVVLAPTNLRAEELDYLVEQTARCERFLHSPAVAIGPDAAADAAPLRAQASMLLQQLNETLFALRDDCFDGTIQVASADPVSASLMEALGTTITGHVTAQDNVGGAPKAGILKGGYDWAAHSPGTAEERTAARFAHMEPPSGESGAGMTASDRLRRLFDAEQAGCAFRLPLPRTGDFPGLTTRRSRALPPPVTHADSGVLIGENVYRGMRQPVFLQGDDRRRHAYIVGQTGTGKSSLLLNMILQDIASGKGVGVLDPHGELVDEILPRIPRERADDVIYINSEQQDAIVGLNMLQYRNDLDRDSAVNHLLEIFYRLYRDVPEAMGPAFEQYFRNSALLEMVDPTETPTLDGIVRVFSDEDYRKKKLSKCSDPLLLGFWRIAHRAHGEQGLANYGPYVTSKLTRILYNQLIRRMVLQPESTLDFKEIMDGGKILLVDLCKGKLGDTNAAFLAMVLISLIQRGAFARTADRDKGQLRDFYLYIDEFQNVATDSFVTILSEARKYRLNAILANQYVQQIPEDVREAVEGNVGTLIAFRAGAQDAELLEKRFAPSVTREDLMSLPNFHAYVATLVDGAATPPFSMRTIREDTPSDRSVAEVIMAGAGRYGRSVAEVDAGIESRWSSVGAEE